MDTFLAIIFSLFFGFAPMFIFAIIVYWIDRYEKEPVILLGLVFIWGAVLAAGAAFVINTVLSIPIYLLTGSDVATELTSGTFIAPVVEESLKGFAVLVIFFLFRREFDSIIDGIVYAMVAALGFAATENAYYIFSYGYAQNGWSGLITLVFVRVILVGWQHPFYTSFTGIGLAVSRLSRNSAVKLFAPMIGWGIAVFLHAFHNTISSLISGGLGLVTTTAFDWTGWFIMFIFILWALYREQHWVIQELQEEVSLGLITSAQYTTACSAWKQSGARLSSLFSGNYNNTNRFYQLAGELAYKKHQRSSLGEEGGNTAIIDRLRGELASLAPSASV